MAQALTPTYPMAAERHPARDGWHTAVLALGWVLIVVMWLRVLRVTDPDLLLLAGVFVAACLLLSVSATTLWVEHNVRIFQEKGPRTGVATAAIAYDRDWTGRPVVADWEAVTHAHEVMIAIGVGNKRYHPTSPADAASPCAIAGKPWTTVAPRGVTRAA